MGSEEPHQARVEAALRAATAPMTVRELSLAVFGTDDKREMGRVYMAIHRMSERGLVEKREATFLWKTAPVPPKKSGSSPIHTRRRRSKSPLDA